MTGYNPCEQPTTGSDPCHQIRIDPFLVWWKLDVNLTGAQWKFQATLSQGEGFAVSDGSFKDEKGAVAWIIETATADTRLISQWHTPGQTEDHSSFRSELAGIVGVLYTLTFWPPASERPYFRLACHGLSVVSRLSSNHPIEPTEPHSDLLESVRALIVTSKYHIDLQFV